jgi:hypothetical protein
VNPIADAEGNIDQIRDPTKVARFLADVVATPGPSEYPYFSDGKIGCQVRREGRPARPRNQGGWTGQLDCGDRKALARVGMHRQ